MAMMSQMDHYLGRSIRTRTNYIFVGQPAIGKTYNRLKYAMARQQEDPNFLYVPFDGGTLQPTDTVMAMPHVAEGTIRRCVDETLLKCCEPGAYGVIDIGEWPLMSGEVRKGFQKMIGHEYFAKGRRISPDVVFWADGNRLKDKSGAQAGGTRALDTRWLNIEMQYDVDYGMEAFKNNYHPTVATFGLRNPQYIDNYADVFEHDPPHEENALILVEGKTIAAYANLRSWDAVSRWHYDFDKTGTPIYPEEIQRAVGTGMAETFNIFKAVFDKMASFEEIYNSPKKASVPTNMGECWTMLTMLAMRINKDVFKSVQTYMRRFSHEHQTAFFRLMNDRLDKLPTGNVDKGAIRATEEYADWITQPYINKLLQGASK